MKAGWRMGGWVGGDRWQVACCANRGLTDGMVGLHSMSANCCVKGTLSSCLARANVFTRMPKVKFVLICRLVFAGLGWASCPPQTNTLAHAIVMFQCI